MAERSADNVVCPELNIVVDLPPADTRRWTAKRKALIVDAVRSGVISLEEACRRYQLSVEEFSAWQRAIETHGVGALRVTRLQRYRGTSPAPRATPCY
jgi:transposase-like protein